MPSQKQSSHQIEEEEEKEGVDVSKMGVDEYLRRFISEDNASFQQLHESEREEFRKRFGWMFEDSAKANVLNRMAI